LSLFAQGEDQELEEEWAEIGRRSEELAKQVQQPVDPYSQWVVAQWIA